MRNVLTSAVVPKKSLRSLTGKLSFLAGLIPQLKPFLGPLWACGTHIEGGPTPVASTRHLPQHLVHFSRLRPALEWINAFLTRQSGTLVRVHPLQPLDPSQLLVITTDASPWGIGAVLSRDGVPIAWWADKLHQCDLDRFQAQLGDSAAITTLGSSSHLGCSTHLETHFPASD